MKKGTVFRGRETRVSVVSQRLMGLFRHQVSTIARVTQVGGRRGLPVLSRSERSGILSGIHHLARGGTCRSDIRSLFHSLVAVAGTFRAGRGRRWGDVLGGQLQGEQGLFHDHFLYT